MVPLSGVRDVPLESIKALNGGPRRVDQNTARRDQNIAVLLALDAFVLEADLPFRNVLLPPGTQDARVEVQVAVERPLLNRGLDVVADVGAAGVKPLPVGVGVEGEGLSAC